VLQDHGAIRIDDKADIEEPVGPVFVPRFGLCHDEDTPAPREAPEAISFRAGYVDRAGPRELGVIDVEHLVVEALQCAFGNGDEADGNVEARQPKRRLGEAFEMLEILFDIFAAANAPKARDQTDRGIGFDHVPPLNIIARHSIMPNRAARSRRA
jgi:hypothetical protein